MKKLISVFAALALVGSLAAQKGKKKAPAIPAVPKAPAMPAVAAAAPAMAGAAKGMGLFIDLRGSYTFANGTSTAGVDGTTSATVAATDSIGYKTSASQAIGGGVSIGYDIAANLGIVASYDIRSFKTREFKGRGSDYGLAGFGGSTNATYQQKWTNQVIGIGFRPHVKALGGEWFAGAGFAMVLPFETVATVTVTTADATFNTNSGTLTKIEQTKGYNLAMGAYAELGYAYMFTDMIGLNLGLRALVATADNIGKTLVSKNTGTSYNAAGSIETTTTTYKESISGTETAALPANTASSSSKLAQFETLGITDFSANVGVSLKF